MADNSAIEWTDATWNPVTGCAVVSAGCRNCYAMRLAGTRLKHHPSRTGLTTDTKRGPVWTGEVRFNAQWLDQPLRWRRSRMVFVCAHGDLFAEGVPDEWIDQVFAVMALSPAHTFQVLTKRPTRMRHYLTRHRRTWNYGANGFEGLRAHLVDVAIKLGHGERWREISPQWPLPNVWLGVSVEDQATANARVPILLDTPAAVRWCSAEPLLGPVDFRHMDVERTAPNGMYQIDALTGRNTDMGRPCADVPRLDWIVTGGESGPNARPMHPDWPRRIRYGCTAAGVAFLHKQNGAWRVVYDRDLDDPDWRRCDEVKRRTPDGRWLNLAGGHGFHGKRVVRVVPTSKAAAGRLLDGRTHDAWPAIP